MMDELENLLPDFPGRKAHVRCFAHTVNLTAKGVLRPFEPVKHRRNDERNDDMDDHVGPDDIGLEELYAELKDIEENGDKDKDDVEGFVAVLDEMTIEERETWHRAVEPVKSMLFKTRKISYKIINSPTQLLSKWREQLAGTDLAERTLLRDVATRWNSTHNMLDSFLQLKTAVMEFLDHASYGLSNYALTDEEWSVVEGLVSALQILQDVTLFFSASGSNIASVIPAMDIIDEAFATGILNGETLSEPIRHALSIGKRTLNKYYSLTDDSDLYRIAMVLHPSYKLEYFRGAHWIQEWIDAASHVTRIAWEKDYKPMDDDNTSQTMLPGTNISRQSSFVTLMNKHRHLSESQNNADELTRYLADGRVITDDPLQWWLTNRKLYPNLAKFAISVHSIPATSVAVERTFSRGRILISHLRNRLRANTIQALMCFGDWSRDDYITNEELVQFLVSEEDEEGDDILVDDDVDI